jgi:lambda family phage minor tail protein L
VSLVADVQKASPGSLLRLFEIDFTTTGLPDPPTAMHLYSGLKENYGNLFFGGDEYTPFPVQISGLKKSSDGPLPRPVFSISNATGFMSQQLMTYNDFLGAKVLMYRTFAKYLDGEPQADPTAKTTEVYFVEQKKHETTQVVQLVLASAIDIMGATLPSRNMLANTCLWNYKSDECSWPGTDSGLYFDASDDPVVDQADDTCGKRLRSCKRRFCQYNDGSGDLDAPNARLPYGGFPVLGRIG